MREELSSPEIVLKAIKSVRILINYLTNILNYFLYSFIINYINFMKEQISYDTLIKIYVLEL